MGKIGPRLSSRKKAKRWRKGQSSSSNPETKKHREIARSYFFQENLGSTGLTTDKLKKHDALQGIPSAENIEVDDESIIDGTFTVKTCSTFASDLSNCSNLSFNRFLNHFQSNSIIHKEMLAVLAAVTEVIKENGGTESSTEYYAALMTTLEAAESEESIIAILSLLGMVLKTIPKNVLRVQFGQASQVFLQILSKYAVTENFLILRHCIGCISLLLRVQEMATWSNSSTIQILNGLLTFTTHEKPRVRKAAQHSICAILKGSDIMRGENPPICHPAAAQIAKQCLVQLESAGQPGNMTSALHTLTLLKDICHQFPKNHIKSLCEKLLGIMTLNDVKAKACCFQMLYSLFVSRPSETTLPSQLNGQIINALYDYQPSLEDEKLTPVWLVVMQEAHCNLASTSLQLCAANVPRFLEKCMEICQSNRQVISRAVPKTIDTILQMCIAPLCVDEQLTHTYKNILHKTIQIVKQGMNYRYNSVWEYICSLLAVLFQIIGQACEKELIEVLKELADLRESVNFTYKDAAEFAVGAAVKSLGPKIVLQTLPIKSGEDDINLNRCDWLLPVLENCISHATIAYFTENLLPLALMCEKKITQFKENGNKTESHIYELLMMRIWALLPSFCNSPTDINNNFQNIARTLGTALNVKKDLRSCVLSALRKLILKSTENNNIEDIKQLARFAKNFLPIFFNIYTTKPTGSDEQGVRFSTFDTIKIYLKIASKELIGELFDNALEKLQNKDSHDFMKESVFDLIRLLTQFTDIDRLKILYEMCKPILKKQDKNAHTQKEQKKAYRFLEEICGSESEICKKFVLENRHEIEKVLVKVTQFVLSPSKGARIRTITHLVKNHPKLENTKFLKAIVPEAILCIKEQNEKCRTSSFDLLNAIADKFLGHDENFKEYINILIVSLGGPSIYCSATLLALSSMTYNYNGSLGVQTVLQILDRVCELMKEQAREIVSSALAFIKVYLSAMPTPIVAPTLKKLVQSLSSMTDDCKRHFRQKVRDILVKMIRKFGADTITAMVPTSDEVMQKRLKNIRKIEVKKQKVQEERKTKESEKDVDEEFNVKRKPKSIEEILADSDEEFDKIEDKLETKKSKRVLRKGKAWIQENEENIVDFIDPTAARNITASQPAHKEIGSKALQTKTKNNEFKTTSDGRLIIKEGSDDEDDTEVNKKMKKLSFLGDDDYEDDEDDVKSVKSTKSATAVKRKRKHSISTDSVISGARSFSTYQAGGSGIHRPLKASKTEKVERASGAEYRAKKAKGDIKKKGKPDPYAYLPLRRSALNRRSKKRKEKIMKR